MLYIIYLVMTQGLLDFDTQNDFPLSGTLGLCELYLKLAHRYARENPKVHISNLGLASFGRGICRLTDRQTDHRHIQNVRNDSRLLHNVTTG